MFWSRSSHRIGRASVNRGPRRLAAAFLLAAGLAYPVAAEKVQTLAAAKPAPGGERRVALVIGNSAYKTAPLRNPVRDARAMAKVLTETGFSVTLMEDATQAGMRRAIRTFGDELARGGVGLFFYAGHGMQVRGKNFLIPTNADIEREDEVEDQAVDANLVLSKMDTARNTLNVMILDACRNNPFQRSFRSAAAGLAQMDAPSGTLISFATAPGSVAADGDGENGLYTKHLLSAIRTPGLPVEQLFKQVRIGVTKETGDRQIPWESSSLKGDFFFIPEDKAKAEAVQRAAIDRAVTDAVKQAEDRAAKERAELQKKAAEERTALQAEMKKLVEQLLAKQKAEMEDEIRKRTQAQAAAPAPDAAAQAEAARQQAALEAKQKEELAARQRAEQEARQRAELEAKRRAELEAQQRAELEARRRAAEETRLRAEAEARQRAELEAQQRAELEARRRAAEEARLKAEADAKRLADVAARQQAEAEARRRAEEEARRVAELEAKQKAELAARQKAEQEARLRADAEAQQRAELEAKQKAELAARQKAEQEARLRAEVEARQRAELEAKQKAEREALAAQKPQPALQVASIAPTVVAAAAGNPYTPKEGDQWVYENWQTKAPERRGGITIELKAVLGDTILETRRGRDGSTGEWAYAPGIYIVGFGNANAYNFSPFLLAQQTVKVGDSWRNVPFQGLGDCSDNPAYACSFNVKVAAQEKVTVKAGSFDTLRIEIEQLVIGGLGSGRWRSTRLATFWYSPEVKRHVKASFKLLDGGWRGPDVEAELVSYKLN